MPYKSGKMKGELTTTEIRKLIRAHNVLVSIKIPKGSKREDIMAIVKKEGYMVDHEKQALRPVSKGKVKKLPVVDMKKATQVLPKPKTKEEKAVAKKSKDMKKKEKEDKIKAEGVKQGAALQRVLAKKKVAPKAKTPVKKVTIKSTPKVKIITPKPKGKGIRSDSVEFAERTFSRSRVDAVMKVRDKWQKLQDIGFNSTTKQRKEMEKLKDKIADMLIDILEDEGGQAFGSMQVAKFKDEFFQRNWDKMDNSDEILKILQKYIGYEGVKQSAALQRVLAKKTPAPSKITKKVSLNDFLKNLEKISKAPRFIKIEDSMTDDEIIERFNNTNDWKRFDVPIQKRLGKLLGFKL
tara:strand:+ start:1227 stop:2279 length:1053 start_codon:yes stop_codon:yes gene_type:complete